MTAGRVKASERKTASGLRARTSAISHSQNEFLWDGWRPHSAVLGRVDRVKGYHDITRYPHARLIPGLVLFRWDAPLFFANAELFRDRVLDAIAVRLRRCIGAWLRPNL
jgi:MFS superfamily sulfate permease-like transporter